MKCAFEGQKSNLWPMLLHHHRILRTNDERWWSLLLFALSVFKWGPRASPLLWNRAQKSNSQHFWRANLGWTLFSCARLRFDGARGPGQRCGRRCVSPYFYLFFFYLCLPRIIFVINDFIVVVSARRLFFFPSNFSTRPQAHTHTHTQIRMRTTNVGRLLFVPVRSPKI